MLCKGGGLHEKLGKLLMLIYAHTVTKSGICATLFLKHYLQVLDIGNTKGRVKKTRTDVPALNEAPDTYRGVNIKSC